MMSNTPGSTTLFMLMIEHGERFGREWEFHRSFFARLQIDAPKASQLHHRPRDGADSLMNVHLRHFVAFARCRYWSRPRARWRFRPGLSLVGSTRRLSKRKVV